MWVVVIEGDNYPEVVGPFRSGEKAERLADQWNATHKAEDGYAHARPCLRSLSDVSD